MRFNILNMMIGKSRKQLALQRAGDWWDFRRFKLLKIIHELQPEIQLELFEVGCAGDEPL